MEADDFCNELARWQKQKRGQSTGDVRSKRRSQLVISELLTISVYYHLSGYKCFQYYYERLVLGALRPCFPKAVSYNRFIELLPRALPHLFLFAQVRAAQAERTGIYFVDSKKLPVCDSRRIHQHRVFKGIATHGKSSTGWFFGFKIHLIINHLGQIVQFKYTPANVADNNATVLTDLFEALRGKCVGDKGYISKLFQQFYEQGLHILTKLRKNMKNQLLDMKDKLLLRKRAIIESVNDILMSVCDIDHTRHRSPYNAAAHLFAGIIAYDFLDSKPSICIRNRNLF